MKKGVVRDLAVFLRNPSRTSNTTKGPDEPIVMEDRRKRGGLNQSGPSKFHSTKGIVAKADHPDERRPVLNQ